MIKCHVNGWENFVCNKSDYFWHFAWMHLQNGNLKKKEESWQRSFTSKAFQIPDKKAPDFFCKLSKNIFSIFLHRLRLDSSKKLPKREKENPKKRKKILETKKTEKNSVPIFPLFQEQVIKKLRLPICKWK